MQLPEQMAGVDTFKPPEAGGTKFGGNFDGKGKAGYPSTFINQAKNG